MLINVRSHLMFWPVLIYIFDLIVNLMLKSLKIDVCVLKKSYKSKLLIEMQFTKPQYSAHKI